MAKESYENVDYSRDTAAFEVITVDKAQAVLNPWNMVPLRYFRYYRYLSSNGQIGI